MLSWSAKYPDEVLHYQLDWGPALATGDSIANAAADATGPNVAVVGTVGAVTTVTISGGTASTLVIVRFSATTVLGETLEENVSLAINSRG